MPKTKRESSESDSSSDTSVHDSPPPAKKNKSSEKAGNAGGSSGVRSKNGEISWNLSSNKLVKVRTFKGKTYIDIREYYEKDGEQLPTKKGISLTPDLYQKLKALHKEIDEELNRT